MFNGGGICLMGSSDWLKSPIKQIPAPLNRISPIKPYRLARVMYKTKIFWIRQKSYKTVFSLKEISLPRISLPLKGLKIIKPSDIYEYEIQTVFPFLVNSKFLPVFCLSPLVKVWIWIQSILGFSRQISSIPYH